MGTETIYAKGCNVVRLTEADDVTTDAGHHKALKAVRAKNVRLCAAMPCVGGSPWNVRNYKTGSAKTRAKIERHWAIFDKMWERFVEVAEACLAFGPTLPTACRLLDPQAVHV